MNFDFKKATFNDVDELARIRSIFLLESNDVCTEDDRLKLEQANRSYFQKSLLDASFVAWLALKNERIVATSGLSFSLVPPSYSCPDGKVAYIMNMFTFPEYRKNGLGTKLFKLITDEAIKKGYKKLTLNATDMGKPLYERYGFKDIKGDMVYYIK